MCRAVEAPRDVSWLARPAANGRGHCEECQQAIRKDTAMLCRTLQNEWGHSCTHSFHPACAVLASELGSNEFGSVRLADVANLDGLPEAQRRCLEEILLKGSTRSRRRTVARKSRALSPVASSSASSAASAVAAAAAPAAAKAVEMKGEGLHVVGGPTLLNVMSRCAPGAPVAAPHSDACSSSGCRRAAAAATAAEEAAEAKEGSECRGPAHAQWAGTPLVASR
mmetsp:Transcript_127661/g.408612  ORF Transcript_127661/g.408612 Transcript_127661/m.408612 type:complete len:224 (-) Transcript_127661:481-1152(-)